MLRCGQRIARKEIKQILSSVARTLDDKKLLRVSIAFIDKKTIKKLNKEYRGKDQVTDVLSFNIDEPDILGEVLICYDQAKKQAEEKKQQIKKEIKLLITHGVLHLLGYDHKKKQEAEIMEALQDWVLDEIK